MFTLYAAPNSISLAPQIALEDAGAPYRVVRVDLRAGEQRGAGYLATNPKGRVPSLVTDRGILTETPAILAFVAQSFPEAGLAPLDDPWELARVHAFNAYLCSTVHVAHAHGPRGTRWADDPAALAELKRKVPEVVGASFRLIERELFVGPWVMGDRYTICDPYLFTLAQWLETDGVDPASVPVIAAHRARMIERPSVQRAKANQGA